ncbi:MAG: anti-sigma factor [Burkholderiales bacterium]
MDCKETRDLLPAHADRELGLRDAVEIDRHLIACPACQGEFARQSALRAAVKKHATRFTAPPHLENSIQAALPGETAHPAVPVKRMWHWNWLNVGAALASAVAIVWSFGLYLAVPSANDRIADEVVSSHVRSLMVNHIADIASSDQHTVKPWFNGKLDFSPTVSDFTAQGFPLVGARLDYLHGRPVAALVYRHRQHWINEYVWPASNRNESENALYTLNRQGFHIVHWSEHGMIHWVISDLNPRDLMTLVQLLRSGEGSPMAWSLVVEEIGWG